MKETPLTDDLNKIDLRLLDHLDALVSEGHVSRAAERVGVGQPTMSATLARLRKLTGDPLLVRGVSGMVATPRALELVAQLRPAVASIRKSLSTPERFSPATAVRTFHIMGVDSLAWLLLPRLLAHFAAHAPGISATFTPVDGRLAHELLESNDCDLVIGYLPDTSGSLRTSKLFQQTLYAIAREGHPGIQGSITLEQFVQWPQVVFGDGATPVSFTEVAVEKALRRLKKERVIGARVSSALMLPVVVAATDMVGTVAERTARLLAPIAPVQLLPSPLELPKPAIVMAWHDRAHNDAGHRWLRSAIRQLTTPL